MNFKSILPMLLLGSGSVFAQFPPQIKNVILIIQENRTPDNLFHFLSPQCLLGPGPGGEYACTPAMVTDKCYNIAPCGLSNESGTLAPVTLTPVPLSGSVDPSHKHAAWYDMCDPDPATLKCRMDGAWQTTLPKHPGFAYAFATNPPVTNYDGSKGHLLDPYLTLATQYGWANYMYQSNQGPSYPAHQFLFSGTSAPTAADDAKSTFIAENFNKATIGNMAGCLAPGTAYNYLLSPAISSPPPGCGLYDDNSVQECKVDNTALIYPTDPVGSFCYPHETMAHLLDSHSISWNYYSPKPGSIWTSPDSFNEICKPEFVNPNGHPDSKLQCTGALWNEHVDFKKNGTDILRDIENCDLAQMSWAIPDGAWSDHAGTHDQYGPSWVAAIVDAIGNHKTCGPTTKDAGQTYWEDTAIVITWDDWGGWSDHVPPHLLSALPCKSTDCPGDYQDGFRVPLIVVSAYTPDGYIDNEPHDFGSILRMIEGVFHIPEGSLGFADSRAKTDLHKFFQSPLIAPRKFSTIPAVKNAHFFLTYTAAPIDPDDD